MILSGEEIKRNIGSNIIINPYDETQINPNSYNLKLHNEMLIYKNEIIDPKENNETTKIIIPDEGYVLEPGQLYLGRTCEYTETHGFVPMVIGRSSVGRIGVSVHISAGFGDVGYCGFWTLQLTCIKKVKIYPFMKICQIFYNTVLGESFNYHSEKYQDSKGIVSSQLFKEL